MRSRGKNRGYFVAVDGPNGSGKTTLIKVIARKLERIGYKVKVTREPTNTKLGKTVRECAEKQKGLSIACMVTADRYLHIENEIEPLLNTGNIVITDRYLLSSLILQRMDGVDAEYIMALNSMIIRPDLQLAIYADKDNLQKRLAERDELTRFEKGNRSMEELLFMKKGVEILRRNEITVLEINNDTDLDKNADMIVSCIVKEVTER